MQGGSHQVDAVAARNRICPSRGNDICQILVMELGMPAAVHDERERWPMEYVFSII